MPVTLSFAPRIGGCAQVHILANWGGPRQRDRKRNHFLNPKGDLILSKKPVAPRPALQPSLSLFLSKAWHIGASKIKRFLPLQRQSHTVLLGKRKEKRHQDPLGNLQRTSCHCGVPKHWQVWWSEPLRSPRNQAFTGITIEMVRVPLGTFFVYNVIQPVKSRLRTERTQPLKPGAKSLRGEGFALASVAS